MARPATSSAAVNAGQSFDWKNFKAATFGQHLTGRSKADDWSDATYRFGVFVGAAVTEHSELKVTGLVDYKNKPPLPEMKKADSAVMVALVVKF